MGSAMSRLPFSASRRKPFPKAESSVADLGTRLLAGVKVKYGPDSSEYEMAGGTRASEIKRSPHKKADVVAK